MLQRYCPVLGPDVGRPGASKPPCSFPLASSMDLAAVLRPRTASSHSRIVASRSSLVVSHSRTAVSRASAADRSWPGSCSASSVLARAWAFASPRDRRTVITRDVASWSLLDEDSYSRSRACEQYQHESRARREKSDITSRQNTYREGEGHNFTQLPTELLRLGNGEHHRAPSKPSVSRGLRGYGPPGRAHDAVARP